MFLAGVKGNHTVWFLVTQNGSSGATVPLETSWLTVKGIEGATAGWLKSSFGGGGGMTVMFVAANPVFPDWLSPWNVTKKDPVWLLAGVQLNVSVLLPLSMKVAPVGSTVAVKTTCWDAASVAETVKFTCWFSTNAR